ncbi:hypothetical protein JI664_09455 [Rhodobacter sp. NTK016B]|uniref:hypothetical protein n=1 Tax=Rhodobacter sp. NTK016B TaxID=2759676 RepID=UPI001A8F1BBC|nr:hypothetical protein [Rhodobacter sp. NTK016B]MBN8292187.1 hypothetical protein [Rhodobacter sp. NTK016B]
MPFKPLSAALRALVTLIVLAVAGTAGAQIDTAAREGRRALGMNLAEVVGWSTELPFIDVMHSAARWTGHTGSGWGGMDADALEASGALDADGWVPEFPHSVRRLSTFVLVDLPAEMTSAAGTWHATWEGTAYLGFTGAARNVRYGDNSATFEFTPGQGSVLIEFNRGSLRNLSIVHERNLERHAAGEIFNPDWLARVADMEILRFMDWMLTNNSTLSHWRDRPQVGDYTYARHGVPVEIMLALANQTGAEPWFTLPHLADDDYVRQFAQMVKDGLNPDLRAWYEFSNEIWNWGFTQADWAEQNARARWNRDWAWVQFGAVRAAEVMRVIDTVYAGDEDRRVRVLGLFTAWLGLEHDMLEAPDYIAEDPAHRPPHEAFDALAVTGYFSAELHSEDKAPLIRDWLRESRAEAEAAARAQGLSGGAFDDYVAAHRFDRAIDLAAQELTDGSVSGDAEHSVRDLIDRTLTHHAQVAEEYGMALVMYEGGTHVVVSPSEHSNEDLVEFFEALNYSEAMGVVYGVLLEGWQRLTPSPFVAYMDIGQPSIWGSWGHLRHLDDDTSRWRALMEATAP